MRQTLLDLDIEKHVSLRTTSLPEIFASSIALYKYFKLSPRGKLNRKGKSGDSAVAPPLSMKGKAEGRAEFGIETKNEVSRRCTTLKECCKAVLQEAKNHEMRACAKYATSTYKHEGTLLKKAHKEEGKHVTMQSSTKKHLVSISVCHLICISTQKAASRSAQLS